VNANQGQAIDREQVTSAAWNFAKRIALLTVLAVVVVWLQSLLGYLGTVLVVFFLALAGVFLVRSGYALLLGLIAFLSTLFARPEDPPKATWRFAWNILNALEVAVCLGLAMYVLRAAGWWTEIQLPVAYDYQLPHL
jgi:hypothetical protein